MDKKPRETAESVRNRALTMIVDGIYQQQAPVALTVPETEVILAQSYQMGNRISRSSLYRLWPHREDLLAAVIGHMLDSDIYASKTIRERAIKIGAKALGKTTEGEQKGDISVVRPKVIAGLGRVVVEATNHVVAARIEAVVSSAPDLGELNEKLAEVKGAYVAAVGDSYEYAHDLLGDSLAPRASYGDYAQNAIALARGIALSPLPAAHNLQNLHAKQFELLADHFTRSA